MNEIVTQTNQAEIRETLKRYIASKLLPAHIRTVDQAEVIVGIGREIGLPMIASMRTIHLINGSPTVSPAMMIALANKRQFIDDQKLEKFDDRVIFSIKRKGRETWHKETFGVKEATALGLMAKDNYKKQPITMFAWRAVSAAMRFMFPDVIFGLYTPEEMGAVIDIDPENELEARTVLEEKAAEVKAKTVVEERQLSYGEAQRLTDGVKEILRRLGTHCGGDPEKMNAQLMLLTEHKKDGEVKFVTIEQLETLPETNPAWIDAILKKMDRAGLTAEDANATVVEGTAPSAENAG